MKLFKSSDEKKLKAARASRDGLRDRLATAEGEMLRLGAEAERLAIAGDDAALEEIERQRDGVRARIETLTVALATAEQRLRGHEDEVAAAADNKARIETADEIEALKAELLVREESFQTASQGLQTITARIGVFLLDAVPLERFAAAARNEVGPAVEMIISMMDAHRKAVLNGSAAPRLPQLDPAPVAEPNARAPVDRLYAYRNIKWLDPETGEVRTAAKYSTADVPRALACLAIERGWADLLLSERAQRTAAAHGNGVFWALAEDCYDIESGAPPEHAVAAQTGAEWFGDSVAGMASVTERGC